MRRFALLPLLLLLSGCGGGSSSGPGGLGFNGSGLLLRGLEGSQGDFGRAVAVLPDGKILLAGEALLPKETRRDADLVLLRLNPDGSLDDDFGSDGLVVTDAGGSEYARALALQSDGKILVGGYSTLTGTGRFLAARYTADGRPDVAFGNQGVTIVGVGSTAVARTMGLQRDGRIVLGGSAFGVDQDFALVRLNPDGTLDASFGAGGAALVGVDSGHDHGNDLVVLPDDRIVLAGASEAGEASRAAVARFDSQGRLDPGFDGGKVLFSFGGRDELTAVAAAPDGAIIVGGKAASDRSASAFALARLRADGKLDAGFGTQGKVVTDRGAPWKEFIVDIALLADGGLAVLGQGSGFLMARYLPTGAVDTAFGSGGFRVVAFDGKEARPASLAIQPDGKWLAAGSVALDLALIRCRADGSPDAP